MIISQLTDIEGSAAYRPLWRAVGLALVIPILFWVLQGQQEAFSALLGIILWTLPNTYFAYKLFGSVGKLAARGILATLYQAEGVKLLLSMLLFLVIVKFLSIVLLFLLVGYVAVQLLFWVCMISREMAV